MTRERKQMAEEKARLEIMAQKVSRQTLIALCGQPNPLTRFGTDTDLIDTSFIFVGGCR